MATSFNPTQPQPSIVLLSTDTPVNPYAAKEYKEHMKCYKSTRMKLLKRLEFLPVDDTTRKYIAGMCNESLSKAISYISKRAKQGKAISISYIYDL